MAWYAPRQREFLQCTSAAYLTFNTKICIFLRSRKFLIKSTGMCAFRAIKKTHFGNNFFLQGYILLLIITFFKDASKNEVAPLMISRTRWMNKVRVAQIPETWSAFEHFLALRLFILFRIVYESWIELRIKDLDQIRLKSFLYIYTY